MRAKQTGKEIIIALVTALCASVARCFRGTRLEQQRAKIGHVVSDLEDRLRKVEIEALRFRDLPPSRVEELKAEKHKLLVEIDAVSRAASLKSRIRSSSFQ
jgi:hypothetical protein